uniref:Uncharacterized protein n=1 Tax=viral metagenome TaxID=1070528 RepID=A0A6C0KPQ2_9ZZZZ
MSYLNAFGGNKAFAQSGGGYFYILDANLPSKLQTWGSPTLPSGSGGAWSVGSFAPALNNTTSLPGNISSLFGSGRLVRDMGKTLVSAGRSFRKIKGILPVASNATPDFGVPESDAGPPAGAVNSVDQGYLTFYVEMGRNGMNMANIPQLVRFM